MLHGSWNHDPPSGYGPVRVHDENGRPMSIQPFLAGSLAPSRRLGRPSRHAAALPGRSPGERQGGAGHRVSYAGR